MFSHTRGAVHGQSKRRTTRIASPVCNHLEVDWETISAGGRHGQAGTGDQLATRLQVWWLTLPAGVFTAWICYAIYPWGFSQSHQTSRAA
jgi:hypothetical protein